MTRQITLDLPDAVYEQVEQMAEAGQQSIADLLVDTIVQAAPIFSVDPDRSAMLREAAAYRSMHADLLKKYEGQFVAIHQGKVIDHDVDELDLSRRIRQQFPREVILVRQVLPQAEHALHFRSPRLIPSE